MTYSKGKDLNIARITPPSITSQGVSGILLPTQVKIPEQPVKLIYISCCLQLRQTILSIYKDVTSANKRWGKHSLKSSLHESSRPSWHIYGTKWVQVGNFRR